jgi:hypothetical protein
VRRVALLALLGALMIACQGCLVVALHPVYDPDSIAFEPALVGTWTSDEDNLTVTFDRAEWHSYHLVLDDSGKITRLSARLTRLADDVLLLDLTPLDGTDVPELTLPVHLIFRVTVEADALTIATLNYDRFYGMAKAGPAGLGLAIDGRQNAVITAGTPELRAWLAAHANDDGVFAAPTTLKRRSQPPAGH